MKRNAEHGAQQASDEELMHQYRLGRQDAFEELYRRYAPRIFGYLLKRVSKADAPEVFQETFLRLHRYRGRYDRSYQFAAWLFAICRSAAIDTQRKSGRLKNRTSDAEVEEIAVEQTDSAAAPGSSPALAEALAELPGRDNEALALRFGSDLSFEQVAVKLGTSNAAARKIVSRALSRLRGMLK